MRATSGTPNLVPALKMDVCDVVRGAVIYSRGQTARPGQVGSSLVTPCTHHARGTVGRGGRATVRGLEREREMERRTATGGDRRCGDREIPPSPGVSRFGEEL